MFSLRRIDQMEPEVYKCLEWELIADPPTTAALFLSSPNTMLGLQAERPTFEETLSTASSVPSFGSECASPSVKTPGIPKTGFETLPTPTYPISLPVLVSLASSRSPATPVGGHAPKTKICGINLSTVFSVTELYRQCILLRSGCSRSPCLV